MMKKIAIIGGGIIGMTLANYLDTDKFEISLFDDEKKPLKRVLELFHHGFLKEEIKNGIN
jgi:2-polyprenyl-6-methoxyphenol hydroxylase-like FAD-dependent oxidoreductase